MVSFVIAEVRKKRKERSIRVSYFIVARCVLFSSLLLVTLRSLHKVAVVVYERAHTHTHTRVNVRLVYDLRRNNLEKYALNIMILLCFVWLSFCNI